MLLHSYEKYKKKTMCSFLDIDCDCQNCSNHFVISKRTGLKVKCSHQDGRLETYNGPESLYWSPIVNVQVPEDTSMGTGVCS